MVCVSLWVRSRSPKPMLACGGSGERIAGGVQDGDHRVGEAGPVEGGLVARVGGEGEADGAARPGREIDDDRDEAAVLGGSARVEHLIEHHGGNTVLWADGGGEAHE